MSVRVESRRESVVMIPDGSLSKQITPTCTGAHVS